MDRCYQINVDKAVSIARAAGLDISGYTERLHSEHDGTIERYARSEREATSQFAFSLVKFGFPKPAYLASVLVENANKFVSLAPPIVPQAYVKPEPDKEVKHKPIKQKKQVSKGQQVLPI